MYDMTKLKTRYFDIKLRTGKILNIEPPKLKVLKKIAALSEVKDTDDLGEKDIENLTEAVALALSKNRQNFKISKTLDLLLNSRLSSAYVTIKYYGITLFGSGVDAGTKSSGIRNNFWDGFIANVDNGYLIFLLQYGLILTLILLLILLAFSFKIYKNGNVYFALVFSIVIIANIIDANLVSFRIWPILLIFANNYQPDRQAVIYNIFHIRFTSKKKKYN